MTVFILATVTDFLDGYYAKKYNMISDFGKFMDPIADKFLMLVAFFIFARMEIIAMWMFVIIAIREVLITAFRLIIMNQGKVLAAETLGKYKTLAQMIVVIFILLFVVLRETAFGLNWSHSVLHGWEFIIFISMLITVALTLVSGISFLWNNRNCYKLS